MENSSSYPFFQSSVHSYQNLLSISEKSQSISYNNGFLDILLICKNFLNENNQYKNVPFSKLIDVVENRISENNKNMQINENEIKKSFCLKGLKIKENKKRIMNFLEEEEIPKPILKKPKEI